MTMKSLLITGAVALASLGIASAKSYDIHLGATVSVGTTQLKAGAYQVKVNGSQATFTDANTSKSVTAPVKTATGDKKFDQTVVLPQNQNGVDTLHEIDLGGSTTRLQFGE